MSCSALINGVAPSGGGGGSAPSGDAETVWEFDWSAQSAFDFAAAGDGTYDVDGTPATVVNMDRASTFEVTPGVGLQAEMIPGARTWIGTVPTASHVYFNLGDLLPASAFTSGRYWAFWWEVPTWNLPATANMVFAKGVNPVSTSETAFGRNAIWGGGWRFQVDGSGNPVSNYRGVCGSAGETMTRFPQAQDWNVMCLMIWGRLESTSMMGGPLSAWGNPEEMIQIGDHNVLGSAGNAAPGQTFVNPWGGRILWGVSTQFASGSPSATLTRQMITRGPYG